MKTLIAISLLSLITACGVQPVNIVGYGKKLDNAVHEDCFYKEFEKYQASTNYRLSVDVEKEAGKITYYTLTIDGTETDETDEVFTPKSFQQSKVFMADLIKACSVTIGT